MSIYINYSHSNTITFELIQFALLVLARNAGFLIAQFDVNTITIELKKNIQRLFVASFLKENKNHVRFAFIISIFL